MKTEIPTVKLTDLIKDGCNYQDSTFEQFVRRWMNQWMPGFPLGLLETDTGESYDRWHIEPSAVHFVRRATRLTFECSECGETYLEEGEECCHDDDDKPLPVNRSEQPCWVVVNENTDDEITTHTGYVHYRLNHDYDDVGECDALGWTDKAEAEAAANEADCMYESEHGHENRYGFPWAASWCYHPDPRIPTATLLKAGFEVAHYRGGDGDDYRLAGVDGGGYSFATHFARLVAYYHEDGAWLVEVGTAFSPSGKAYITTDYRDDLEKLSDVVDVMEEACT